MRVGVEKLHGTRFRLWSRRSLIPSGDSYQTLRSANDRASGRRLRQRSLSSRALRPESIRYIFSPSLVLRDLARELASPVVPTRVGVSGGALADAIAWLCRSHDATGRQGSSKGFSLLHGWLPAYPETTGYVLGTLLEYARRVEGASQLIERAVEMGAWESGVQEPDGGIMEGHVATTPRRSIVFNTGMVLHGWLDLTESGHHGYEESAQRASAFLCTNLRDDGTWRPTFEFANIPHTYNTRVAWAMLRCARRGEDEQAEQAARAHLDWACSCQRTNGWFANGTFRPGTKPSTHAIAYTLRGLLESYCLTGEERWLAAVKRTAEALLVPLDKHRLLPANFDEDWRPAAAHSCLTGTAQLGGVWLRLYQETGEPRWLNAGLRAVEQAAARQETVHWPPVRGALPGSFPVWGRYAPLQYPNWATKFLADALMLYDDCLRGSAPTGTGSVVPESSKSRFPARTA